MRSPMYVGDRSTSVQRLAFPRGRQLREVTTLPVTLDLTPPTVFHLAAFGKSHRCERWNRYGRSDKGIRCVPRHTLQWLESFHNSDCNRRYSRRHETP